MNIIKSILLILATILLLHKNDSCSSIVIQKRQRPSDGIYHLLVLKRNGIQYYKPVSKQEFNKTKLFSINK